MWQEEVSNNTGLAGGGRQAGSPPPTSPPSAAAPALRLHVGKRTGRAKLVELNYICNSSNSTPELEGTNVPQFLGPASGLGSPRAALCPGLLSTRQPPTPHARS